MPPIKDITGKKFGRLKALRPTKERSGASVVWECVCDCGCICYVSISSLLSGHTRSCGCLRKEIFSKPVRCVETGEVYNSQGEAASAVPTSVQNIAHSIKTNGVAGGFHWAHVTEGDR